MGLFLSWLRLNRAEVTEKARLVLKTAKKEMMTSGVAGVSAWAKVESYKLMAVCWLKLNLTH